MMLDACTMPDQVAEAAEDGGKAGAVLADWRTVNRVIDRGLALGQLALVAMRLPGRRPKDRVKDLEVLLRPGTPLDSALLEEVRSSAEKSGLPVHALLQLRPILTL